MDIRFFHGIIFKKQKLSKEISRLVILSHEEGKLVLFSKENSKRAPFLFEGGYYLMGAVFSKNNIILKEWELIQSFVNPYQFDFIASTQEIIEKYLPHQAGKRYFSFALSALRRINSRKELIKNFLWFMAIFSKLEGMGSILPPEKERIFILHRKIDEKYLQYALEKASKIKKDMIY